MGGSPSVIFIFLGFEILSHFKQSSNLMWWCLEPHGFWYYPRFWGLRFRWCAYVINCILCNCGGSEGSLQVNLLRCHPTPSPHAIIERRNMKRRCIKQRKKKEKKGGAGPLTCWNHYVFSAPNMLSDGRRLRNRAALREPLVIWTHSATAGRVCVCGGLHFMLTKPHQCLTRRGKLVFKVNRMFEMKRDARGVHSRVHFKGRPIHAQDCLFPMLRIELFFSCFSGKSTPITWKQTRQILERMWENLNGL